MSFSANASGSTIIPGLRYRDAHAAIAWLVKAFGFTAQHVYDGPNNTVAHAQLTLGGGRVMLGSMTNEGPWAKLLVQPDEIAMRSTQAISIVVPDAAAVYASAKAAGADIVQELAEMSYGGKSFGCRDPEGHLWAIGEYDPWAPS